MTQRIIELTAAEVSATDLVPVEIVPGLVLWLYAWENVDEIRAQYIVLLDEIERKPGLGEPMDGDGIMALLDGAPTDFAAGLVDVANGASYCAAGIDWAAVEDEPWG